MLRHILLTLLATVHLGVGLSENNDLYNDLEKADNVVSEGELSSNIVELVNKRAEPVQLLQEEKLTPLPYINNYQRHQQNSQQSFTPHYKQKSPYGLDILGYQGGQDPTRPTLDSLSSYAASQGKTVTTPSDLLDMCCQFPACYDPLYELCIDTCRKCETVYPVTSWLPCPPLLNIPDCTSPNLSYMGPLPLVCYPDIGPFGNIIPLDTIAAASQTFSQHGQQGARGGPALDQGGQAYRQAIRASNKKSCSDRGICHSEEGVGGSIWG